MDFLFKADLFHKFHFKRAQTANPALRLLFHGFTTFRSCDVSLGKSRGLGMGLLELPKFWLGSCTRQAASVGEYG
jgi:hypothetical protein